MCKRVVRRPLESVGGLQGDTPLHMAVRENPKVAKLLVNNGAHISYPNPEVLLEIPALLAVRV